MIRLEHTDDQELLQLIQQDNCEAFDELYSRYWKRLYVTASNKTGCEEDAMDLVQDLFVEFWNKRASVSITASLASYLFSCLYYKTFHYFRTKGLQDKHIRNFQLFLQQSDEAAYDVDPVSPYEAELAYEQLQEIINQAIEEMPEKMRQVFQMTRSGERSVAEVADALNLSPQTVKNQAGNAMQRLRKAVSEHAIDLPLGMLIILLLNK
ncbi:RNA polymerase sigma factor [Pontibacter silvestris]|uniref:RNA polymerase sigma factor n=1 Tax=Pontibacter silvestris TaxID=2305183 RepID=A0ABW4WZV8_9BACT|nr:RNA polymerase sigma-70 factor [Pontibacter silvestris]MCC9138851.1 RNA polymerase sigma-70 factor [Pontibacter silvestris]